MTAPEIKGWCPGALRPMLSGDGLVVRIRPRAGCLTSGQAAGIAALAARHGNGLIDLSARANLQIRGVSAESYPPLVAGLADLDLIDADAAAEARRNVIVTPFREAGDTAERLAAALEAALAAQDAPDIPGKFGFAVDCGPVPVLRGASADIRIERAPDGGLIVRADGAGAGARVPEAGAAGAALDLARWFLASGGAPDGRGRMAAHLASGALPPPVFGEVPAPVAMAGAPDPGPTPWGTLIGLAFGQMSAETLAALARCGALRLTPWRMLLIEAAPPDLPDLITRPDDPRRRVVACTGAPSCPQALGETRRLAQRLAAAVPEGSLLHVSGCAKGCAHPSPAPLTLVARAGGRYELIRAGRPSDPGQPVDPSRDALF